MDKEILGAYITGIFGILVALGTLIWQRWQGKEIERVKAQLQQRDFVHRLQFEKEFSIYDELWKDLFHVHEQLVEYLVNARSTTDIFALNQLTVKMFQVAQDFHIKAAKNKPFFSEEIYKQVTEFDSIIYRIPTTIYHGKDSDPKKYVEQISTHSQKLRLITDTVCTLIRGRIYNA